MKRFQSWVSAMVSGLLLAGQALAGTEIYEPFVIDPAKILPVGEQTTQGGFNKPILIGLNFRPKSWAVLLEDARVKQVINSLEIKAGVPLTANQIDGKTYFCSFPVRKLDFVSGGSGYFYTRSAEKGQLCLSDDDGDGQFDHKRRIMQMSQSPQRSWEYTSSDPVRPLEKLLTYKRDDPQARPYGQFNVSLLIIPFTKGYNLCLQETAVLDGRLTVHCQNVVPEVENGPADLVVGKLKVAVKSYRDGVFTYEVVSGFDGDSYPGFK